MLYECPNVVGIGVLYLYLPSAYAYFPSFKVFPFYIMFCFPPLKNSLLLNLNNVKQYEGILFI